MLDIMVDLETRGQRPGCAIVSFGAVAFCPKTGKMDPEGFYQVASRASNKKAKLHEDDGTMAWWAKQSPEARQALTESEAKGAPSLEDGLNSLKLYMTSFGSPRSIRVWGNGADFDNAILAVAYNAVGMQLPWEFWNNRCFRTLKNLAPHIKMERTGTYHNALDDARSQAEHAIRLHKAIRG